MGAESNNRPCAGCDETAVREEMLIVGKSEFVLFMVDVINCSAQMDRKTEKIKIIVKSAKKYLGIKRTNLGSSGRKVKWGNL